MPQLVRLYFIVSVTCLLAHALRAALPELSSIEPIEYDEKAQRLIARGDARLDFKDTRLSANRITYYQKFGLADASGDVTIMKEGYRLLAERINYETEENIFSIDTLRTGQWPVYVSGDNAGGTVEHTTFRDITVYYGEPNFLTPRLHLPAHLWDP